MEDKLPISESLKISRKYTKYYFQKFIPITVYEKKHYNYLYNLHNYYLSIGFALSFIFIYRGFAYYHKIYLIRNNRNDHVLSTGYVIANMIMAYVFGLYIGKSFSCSNVYSQTKYVRKRLSYESKLNINRSKVLENNNNSVYEDYPFIDETSFIFSDIAEEQMKMNKNN